MTLLHSLSNPIIASTTQSILALKTSEKSYYLSVKLPQQVTKQFVTSFLIEIVYNFSFVHSPEGTAMSSVVPNGIPKSGVPSERQLNFCTRVLRKLVSSFGAERAW